MKMNYFLKKHSPTILTVLSTGGVIATSVLAVKATPKALVLLEEAKKEKGENLTVVETVKAAWKPYIPAVVTGASTIACIWGINHLSVKNQASLMSAYALLDNSYKEYRNKVKEIQGEEAEFNIEREIIKSQFNDDMEIQEGKLLFYDRTSQQFFEDTMEHVLAAETKFLENLHNRTYAYLNEYYDILGIPRVEYGYQLGWVATENNDPYNCQELEFNYEELEFTKERTVWVITPNVPPANDYIL